MGLDVNRGREWINQNSAAVTIGAVVVLIFALAYLWIQNKGPSSGPRETPDAYYYDPTTNEYFVGKGDQLPPIKSEKGNDAFKAYIFACNDCSNEADRFTGYFEGFTEKYKQARAEAIEAAKSGGAHPMPAEAMYMEEGYSKGRLISSDAKDWVRSDSEPGVAINVALSKACDGKGRLKPCYPGQK